MKGLSTITIERKFYSTKTKCQKKTSNSIVSDSIFGTFSPLSAIKALKTMKKAFSLFIEEYSKILRHKKEKLIKLEPKTLTRK